ncbi:MAG: TIR domain-containing protein [Bacteroidota bacterium]
MTKSEIKDLIFDDKIDDAFNAIRTATDNGNDIILLRSRWNSLKRDKKNGVVNDDNFNMNRARIVNSLIAIADELPDDSSGGGSGPKKVFISYNHNDSSTANKMRDFLSDNGVSVTIDSDAMQAGENIQSFINKCIRETDITLSLVSKRSLMSAWVGMESVNSLVGEDIANKTFIPVSIETDFFDRSFVRTAVTEINKTLDEINEEIDWRLKENVGLEDLQNERTRYNDLKTKLPTIVASLKGRLTVDISGEKFDEGMKRVLKTIKG